MVWLGCCSCCSGKDVTKPVSHSASSARHSDEVKEIRDKKESNVETCAQGWNIRSYGEIKEMSRQRSRKKRMYKGSSFSLCPPTNQYLLFCSSVSSHHLCSSPGTPLSPPLFFRIRIFTTSLLFYLLPRVVVDKSRKSLIKLLRSEGHFSGVSGQACHAHRPRLPFIVIPFVQLTPRLEHKEKWRELESKVSAPNTLRTW